MDTSEKTLITVQANINAPIIKVWNCWTLPEHIIHWNHASEEWHTPRAENDLRPGGKFLWRMEARDGSQGFDFEGTFETIITHQRIAYSIVDGRKVEITFSESGGETNISEIFEAEDTNSIELQRSGWQAIMNNFKKYVEGNL